MKKKILVSLGLGLVLCLGVVTGVFAARYLIPTNQPTFNDFAYNASRTTGLNYAYNGGSYTVFKAEGRNLERLPAGTVRLTDNAVNWVFISGDGVLASTDDYSRSYSIPIAIATCKNGQIQSVEDMRNWIGGTMPIFLYPSELPITTSDGYYEGKFALVYGAPSKLYVCLGNSDGSYSWVQIASGS